jgi:hypothetical protein
MRFSELAIFDARLYIRVYAALNKKGETVVSLPKNSTAAVFTIDQ